jgi:hypothetical protein
VRQMTPHAREMPHALSGRANAPQAPVNSLRFVLGERSAANGDEWPALSECMTVHADVTVAEILSDLRMQGDLPKNCRLLFVIDHDHDFVGTLPLTRLASAQPWQRVRDLMKAQRPHLERHLFESGGEPTSDDDAPFLSHKAAPATGSIWLAFTFTALTLAILVLVLVALAKI